MKKKRALPYGYTMANGKITVDENEADIIRQIFKEYKDGTTMSELANKLTLLSIPYCEKRVEWNKGVIARIIDNEKYTGIDGYVPIIGIEEYREAQICKTERTKKQLVKDNSNIGMIRAKTVCQNCGERMIRMYEPRNRKPVSWVCSNPSCKAKVYISDELLELRIQERMNLIIENPDLLINENGYATDKAEQNTDTAELKRMCDTNNYTEDQLLEKIIKMAVTRYDNLRFTPVEVSTTVGMAYEKATQQEQFDSELFLQTVGKIVLAENGNITLKLKTNIEI